MGKHHLPKEEGLGKTYPELIKIGLLILPAYLLYLSYEYLNTYYSYFDINIFSYVSINSLVLYAVKSIGLVIYISIFVTIAYLLYDYIVSKSLNSLFDLIIDRFHPLFPNKIVKFLMLLVASVFVLLASYLGYNLMGYITDNYYLDKNYSYMALGSVVLLVVLITYLKSKKYPIYIIFLITVFITSVLVTKTVASNDALSILKHEEFKYIMGSNVEGYGDKVILKYIGKADNHYFLKPYDIDLIIIKKFEDFRNFQLTTFTWTDSLKSDSLDTFNPDSAKVDSAQIDSMKTSE